VQQPDATSGQFNVDPDQVHLVLTRDELATIVTALRGAGLHGFADRLEAVSRLSNPDQDP
jgi:hypothetical protein